MATAPTALASTAWLTAADLLRDLGGIDPSRLRLRPAPGSATEQDVLDIERREQRLYELVDGVLVEKILGFTESELAGWLIHLLYGFLRDHDLGTVAGADGAIRLMPGLVRIPDVSFVSWQRLGGPDAPREPILGLAPDLAIEVLSPGNTPGEMRRKVREYFRSSVRLVWLVDPRERAADVYRSPGRSVRRTEGESLDGGDVLPGLDLPVREVFARTPRSRKKPRR
jgi:Uma2 family endonuclease